jgi:hypothetical protein
MLRVDYGTCWFVGIATIHGVGSEHESPVVAFRVDVTGGQPDTFRQRIVGFRTHSSYHRKMVPHFSALRGFLRGLGQLFRLLAYSPHGC